MKNLIIFALILAAGLTAYPQNSRSSKDEKSNKARSSQVSKRASSKSKSSNSSKNARTRSSSYGKKTNAKSGNSKSKSGAVRSGQSSSRSSGAVRSGSSSSRSSGAVRSGNSSTRSSGAVRSSSSSSRSSGAARSGNSSTRTSGNKSGTISTTRTGYSVSRSGSKSRSSSNEVRSSVNTVRKSGQRNEGNRANKNSIERGNRRGNTTYVRRDGKEFRHQNNEVFVRNRYRVDYRDASYLRRSRDFIRVHDHYYKWHNRRHVRKVNIYNHYYSPVSLEIRRVRYPYRIPVYLDLCWTPHLHHNFMFYYPLQSNWSHHSYGEYIETTSSYEAASSVGSVKRVYGKVEEVFYSPEDKTYTLYFGAGYPYQDFSVVIPRKVAKRFSMSPSWYFEDEHVWVVGLIELWEGRPEIVIHEEQQIRRY